MNDPRTDFGDRLDALAGDATAAVRLRHPRRTGPANSSPWGRVAWVAAALLLIAGSVATWRALRDDPDGAGVVADDTEGTDGPDGTGPAIACSGDVFPLLRSGLPTYDYDPAGSYAAAADLAQLVVRGRVTSAARTAPQEGAGGETAFTELTVTDVTTLEGAAVPDMTVIAYETLWADRSNPDPLGERLFFDDLDFIGFATPWSGRRSDWATGIEGLYLGCGTDTPAAPLIASAAGPGEPIDPTLDELAALLAGSDDAACSAEALAELADLIDPGLDFRYVPAGGFDDLADLVTQVVVAELTQVQQVPNDGPLTDDAFIVLTLENLEVVRDNGDTAAEITGTSLGSIRELTADADRLADRVEVSGVTVLAFLIRSDDQPGGSVPAVEGLYLACDRDSTPIAVVESVVPPGELGGLTIAEIIDLLAQ